MHVSAPPKVEADRLLFFLGGRDLEMIEIRRLIDKHAPGQVRDNDLAWGAKLSDYVEEIAATVAAGHTAVAVELTDDMAPDWPARRGLVLVDHHGARAGRDQPSALEQVFGLLALPPRSWTRRHALVAANDIGHVAGLAAAGASLEEIIAIRAEDRRAQGVSEEDEREAERAIAARLSYGPLTIVETLSNTSSAIADRMLPELGGPGYVALMVAMPEKLSVFGPGPLILALAAAVPDSWSGGALPERGYWGAPAATESTRKILWQLVIDQAAAILGAD